MTPDLIFIHPFFVLLCFALLFFVVVVVVEMNTGGKISVLRRAVGEPNVETEWEPSRQLEILEPTLAVDDPSLWGERSEERSGGVRREVLRYTQEMPLLEQIFASLAARRLRQSGQEGGSYSLDEVNHVLSELMAQAIAQQEEERVQRLLQMQDQFDGLPFLLGASSLRHSTAEIRVARPASDVLRRSLSGSSSSGLPSSPFSSSSSISISPFPSPQTPSAPEDLDLQLPCLICFDAFASSAMKSLDTCDLHKYCAECLGSHLAAQINESLVCFFPQFSFLNLFISHTSFLSLSLSLSLSLFRLESFVVRIRIAQAWQRKMTWQHWWPPKCTSAICCSRSLRSSSMRTRSTVPTLRASLPSTHQRALAEKLPDLTRALLATRGSVRCALAMSIWAPTARAKTPPSPTGPAPGLSTASSRVLDVAHSLKRTAVVITSRMPNQRDQISLCLLFFNFLACPLF